MSEVRVELRDIVTEDDDEAVMGLRRGPGRDAYIGRMVSHYEDAARYPEACPRMWSVHDALASGAPDFVLLDVRGPDQFAAGHVPGARNLPRRKIVESKLAGYPAGTLFVVYCAGPHCNGAARAAIQLARLGRPVKLMIGGVTGWRDEGFALSNEMQAADTEAG